MALLYAINLDIIHIVRVDYMPVIGVGLAVGISHANSKSVPQHAVVEHIHCRTELRNSFGRKSLLGHHERPSTYKHRIFFIRIRSLLLGDYCPVSG